MKFNRVRRKIAVLFVVSAIGALSLVLLGYDTPVSISVAEEPTASPPNAGRPSLPPLVIDKTAPLLLDAHEPEKQGKDEAYLQINNSCYVCHDNYKREALAVIHAKEEIGCADCHGESLDHQNDEDNITPPEIMYPLDTVDSLCMECHESHDAAARDVLKRWSQRCPKKTNFDEVACTDCHGYHRLKKRVVRWDKETGDVIAPTSAEDADK